MAWAVVRLILVPVIVLAVYYLLVVGRIVERIVSFDAPAATLSQQASIEMLEARRAERNYLLLYDPSSLQANRESISKLEQILRAIRDLECRGPAVDFAGAGCAAPVRSTIQKRGRQHAEAGRGAGRPDSGGFAVLREGPGQHPERREKQIARTTDRGAARANRVV